MEEGDAAVADARPAPRCRSARRRPPSAAPGPRRCRRPRRRRGAGRGRAWRGTCRPRVSGPSGAQQLDVAVADVQQHRLDALRLDRLAVRELHPEALLVERDRRVEVLDGDADVVDPAEHGAESTCGGSARRRLRALDPEDLAERGDPTSSCSGVGSLVAIRRWISWPGVWKARASGSRVALAPGEHLDRDRGPPRPTPARASGPGPSTSALEHHRAAGREHHHRRDQVGAAALVLLGTPAGSSIPARRRRSPCARPRGRRRGRGRGARPARAARAERLLDQLAAGGRRRAGAGAAGREATPIGGDHPPVLERQPAAGSSCRTVGITASPRRAGAARAAAAPCRPVAARAPACGPEATWISPSASRTAAAQGRAVDQQAVAKRHAAEAQTSLVLRHAAPSRSSAAQPEHPLRQLVEEARGHSSTSATGDALVGAVDQRHRLGSRVIALGAEAVDGRAGNALRNQWLSLKPGITIGTISRAGSASPTQSLDRLGERRLARRSGCRPPSSMNSIS